VAQPAPANGKDDQTGVAHAVGQGAAAKKKTKHKKNKASPDAEQAGED